jgi:hypothetical protein
MTDTPHRRVRSPPTSPTSTPAGSFDATPHRDAAPPKLIDAINQLSRPAWRKHHDRLLAGRATLVGFAPGASPPPGGGAATSSSSSGDGTETSPSLHGGSGIPGGVSVLKVEESLATLARRGRAVRGVSKEASQSLHGLLISLASCAPQSLHCQQLVRLTNALEEQDPGAVKSMLLFFCLANRFIC